MKMIDDTEQKLIKYGFTSKEIASIKFWSERDGVTHSEVIKRIKRVFVVAIMMLIMLALLSVSEFFRLGNDVGFYIMLSGCIFGVIVVFVMAPMKLGAKIYFKYKG